MLVGSATNKRLRLNLKSHDQNNFFFCFKKNEEIRLKVN